jgi:hypothetical protein
MEGIGLIGHETSGIFLVKSISKETERRRIACKQVWCQAGKSPDPDSVIAICPVRPLTKRSPSAPFRAKSP